MTKVWNVSSFATPIARQQDVRVAPIAIRAEMLTRMFAGRAVLDGLDLTVRLGEFVVLLGASGSGKTTLLRILAGLDTPDNGVARVPQARTVVFQEPRLVPSRKVWRNVVVGLKGAEASRERAVVALGEVGLARHADAWPGTLSGGEAQRVALARALVREPQLLLLDEPFAALDALTRLKMQQLVGDLCRRHGPATLLVTHDVDEAILLADRILVLKEGRLALDEIVSLPHPRARGGHGFNSLRGKLLAELGVAAD
ncbi:MAG TPA: ABC transporter ATP-binding protein [Rhizomicrobium sp.]